MTANTDSIKQALAAYRDDLFTEGLDLTPWIKSLDFSAGKLNLALHFGFPLQAIHKQLHTNLTQYLLSQEGICELELNLTWAVISHAVQKGVKGIPQVKNIIAVASGKGGVGKSTTAVNLALALQIEGAKVGILDADIYGPSQPQMLGSYDRPEATDNNRLQPVLRHGIQSMSIGYLIDQSSAVVWRGPMVSSALQQLLNDTEWDNLDYLIIDLPPGTGDVQLTLSQKVPVSGAVIVTTPQDLALLDAKRAIAMFNKVSVPVLGVIENMSTHICSQCGHQEHIFGQGGGGRMADDYQIPLLGALPLDMQIREDADGGCPSVAADPNSKVSQAYRHIGLKMAARLSLQARNKAGRFPKIVLE